MNNRPPTPSPASPETQETPTVSVPRDGPEQPPALQPRAYFASLSDYNAGDLHGTWLPCHLTPDQLQEGIDEMLATSPYTERYGEPAEEWAIHDYEGFGSGIRLSEHESLDHLHRLATFLRSHGEVGSAWLAATEGTHDNDANLAEIFDETYIGSYPSRTDAAEAFVESLGIDIEKIGFPDFLLPYVAIQCDKYLRDAILSDDLHLIESRAGDNDVHLFWAT